MNIRNEPRLPRWVRISYVLSLPVILLAAVVFGPVNGLGLAAIAFVCGSVAVRII